VYEKYRRGECPNAISLRAGAAGLTTPGMLTELAGATAFFSLLNEQLSIAADSPVQMKRFSA